MENSLIHPDQTFALWAILLSAATIGIWGEKTLWGAKVSGAVITMLVGFLLSNLKIIPLDAPTYSIVWSFLVPFSIPLLLFKANLARIFKESGLMLIAYLMGSIGTLLGTILAYYLIPLGEFSKKLAGVFCATYIGGSVNFFSTAKTLQLDLDSGELLAAATAADNLVMTVFFLILFTLPSIKIIQGLFSNKKSAKNSQENEPNVSLKSHNKTELSLLQVSQCLAISAIICATGIGIAFLLGFPKAGILVSTILIVVLATGFPQYLGRLTVAEEIGTLLMQIFFAVIGASANIWEVIQVSPLLFVFAALILTVHLLVLLLGGKLLGIDLAELIIASNANIGGPTTAAAMASSKQWNKLVTPAILCGTLGYAIATFIGVALTNLLY
ncbi:DUF819 family protein [Crocosphaera sp.]|uniref:DUF819 family protein n=1 Tax=Crocosphaera sp. TaxID=2729996 RepID=UPI00261EAD53|nr:DUF819 family protein [Crocosphaera sp.]MDJ0581219.1 DUF819 family protein [Crocosphaera sp.]